MTPLQAHITVFKPEQHQWLLPPPETWTPVRPFKAPCVYALWAYDGRLTVVCPPFQPPAEEPPQAVGKLRLPTTVLRDLLEVGRVDSALVHDARTLQLIDQRLKDLYTTSSHS